MILLVTTKALLTTSIIYYKTTKITVKLSVSRYRCDIHHRSRASKKKTCFNPFPGARLV